MSKQSSSATPDQQLLCAAFNSRSSTVRFGAAAYDDHDRLIGVGWNGAVTDAETAQAIPLMAWLKTEAAAKKLDPKSIKLVRSTGFHKIMHAEMRLFNNVAQARGKFSDIFRIARLQTVPVSANGKYFGVRKVGPGEEGLWTTCAPCAHVLEIPGTIEEMQTTRGWVPMTAATTIAKATSAARKVPMNYWEYEKGALRAALAALDYDPRDPPPVVETEFMRWQCIPGYKPI